VDRARCRSWGWLWGRRRLWSGGLLWSRGRLWSRRLRVQRYGQKRRGQETGKEPSARRAPSGQSCSRNDLKRLAPRRVRPEPTFARDVLLSH
jgi:hypothetical protein